MEGKKKEGKGSTSAPVTSMDRHASTRGAQRERGTEKETRKRGEGKYECTCHVYGQTHEFKGGALEGEMTGSHN